ncbi:Actin-related protein 2/3 complex subunit 3 [Schistosoma japonicum]|nr:Actin-related protein 2/3 complex subunit 3 [Schistosoma japonicum]
MNIPTFVFKKTSSTQIVSKRHATSWKRQQPHSYFSPGYHSEFVPAPNTVGNMALLPLRTKFRGPAPMNMDLEKDIIDEALYLFKSLIFFRQYELKSEADRVLVYLILYILECLRKLQKCPNRTIGAKELAAMAISRFDIPGDPDFPRELNNMYAKPRNSTEMEIMRGYLTQLRQELGVRLLERVYCDDNSPPSKWWLCFGKRRFMDQTLTPLGVF